MMYCRIGHFFIPILLRFLIPFFVIKSIILSDNIINYAHVIITSYILLHFNDLISLARGAGDARIAEFAAAAY